jgi:sugar O-acyltransferase (sialic acid O-acetyltransferase NeuD family)
MEIKKLTILGISEPTVSMIFDNLESNDLFPEITIINNLDLKLEKEFKNSKFKFKIQKTFTDYDTKFLLGVLKTKTKKQVIESFPFVSSFINLINKQTSISSTTTLGYGCMINSLVSIAAHSHVGNFVSVNRNASIGHHCIIGNFCSINPNATIAGSVNIGNNTTIAMGTNILDGITIGNNCIIGAGSLVTKDIPDNVVAYGNPCQIIRDNN